MWGTRYGSVGGRRAPEDGEQGGGAAPTRWATEEAFQAWRDSQRFAESHAGQTGGPPAGGEGGPPQGHGGPGGGEGSGPVAMGADLLEFEVVLAVTKP